MIFKRSAYNFRNMEAKMFTIERSLAMLEVIENQERVDRCHNAAHGETSSFQNALIVLLSRSAVFEGAIKATTIVKKYGMLKSLWEQILDLQVKP
jgi:hypothetical protein